MKVDFSAQFGGGDAAGAVLEHFRALKIAASGVEIQGFPREQLAFILRVDGQVRSFGFTGLDHVDFDRKGRYVSVDVGIDEDAKAALSKPDGQNPLELALRSAVNFLKGLDDSRLADVDYDTLAAGLNDVADRYLALVREIA